MLASQVSKRVAMGLSTLAGMDIAQIVPLSTQSNSTVNRRFRLALETGGGEIRSRRGGPAAASVRRNQ
jgi:hypothetical protein